MELLTFQTHAYKEPHGENIGIFAKKRMVNGVSNFLNLFIDMYYEMLYK